MHATGDAQGDGSNRTARNTKEEATKRRNSSAREVVDRTQKASAEPRTPPATDAISKDTSPTRVTLLSRWKRTATARMMTTRMSNPITLHYMRRTCNAAPAADGSPLGKTHGGRRLRSPSSRERLTSSSTRELASVSSPRDSSESWEKPLASRVNGKNWCRTPTTKLQRWVL